MINIYCCIEAGLSISFFLFILISIFQNGWTQDPFTLLKIIEASWAGAAEAAGGPTCHLPSLNLFFSPLLAPGNQGGHLPPVMLNTEFGLTHFPNGPFLKQGSPLIPPSDLSPSLSLRPLGIFKKQQQYLVLGGQKGLVISQKAR